MMSLAHSARMNGHDHYAYLKDVLERLPTQPASRIDELLPYRWTSALNGREAVQPATVKMVLAGRLVRQETVRE
jgi:hypothetical protein